MGKVHRDVTAGGIRLRVAEKGDGEPVLLIHGLFVDHSSWDPVVEALGPGFRCIAPDLPGFGGSEKPSPRRYAYGVPAFAESVASLYGGLGIGRAAIVGHGLGGAVALTLVLRHPELASRLVLMDATCYPATLDLPQRFARVPVVGGFLLKQLWGRASFRRYFRERFLSPHARVDTRRIDRYYDSFNTPAARGSALATLRASVDTRGIAARTTQVQMETLVLWGRGDKVYPARDGQRLAREIRGAGFELLDTGHAPHEEDPEAVATVLGRFLRAERPSLF